MMRSCFLLAACFIFTACAQKYEKPAFKPKTYADLPGWGQDSSLAALSTFLKSCERIGRVYKVDMNRRFGPDGVGGRITDWQPACNAAKTTPPTETTAQQFFESWFQPWSVEGKDSGKKRGLFTGYYEASLRGSYTRHGRYQTPIHSLPNPSVLASKPSRADILSGRAGPIPVLLWVDDPIGAFFMHVQGSGRIYLDNGQVIRIGYAGQNGYKYHPIGRTLIDRGYLEKDKVSAQRIRAFLEANPHMQNEIMNTNPSYIFFRNIIGEGPIGAEGIPLTPERSLAVDKTSFPYGAPMWVDLDHPNLGVIRKLMIAQDTGGAIRGAVRGDFFFGAGTRAENLAGVTRSQGQYWILLPKGFQSAQGQ